ncbi:hypothetical protein L596_005634 [Steinernema carpocapsae]|uniref:Uncharacterized protein n=1 Tax=Steinernema carpocapsae TaxID=34508 RepID=A0A4U8UZW7_STECR|nr:hypothetical protein L596_005634 [Steinernema carpocapsae]
MSSELTSQARTGNDAEDVAEHAVEDVAWDVPEDVAEDVIQNVAEDLTDDVFEDVTGHVAEGNFEDGYESDEFLPPSRYERFSTPLADVEYRSPDFNNLSPIFAGPVDEVSIVDDLDSPLILQQSDISLPIYYSSCEILEEEEE